MRSYIHKILLYFLSLWTLVHNQRNVKVGTVFELSFGCVKHTINESYRHLYNTKCHTVWIQTHHKSFYFSVISFDFTYTGTNVKRIFWKLLRYEIDLYRWDSMNALEFIWNVMWTLLVEMIRITDSNGNEIRLRFLFETLWTKLVMKKNK